MNAGLDPSDDRWVDTTEGGHYWDPTQAIALECERLWDAVATDVPAAAFIPFAYGEYLDEHGETYNVARKAAVKAVGTVRFGGAPGAVVATGTRVAVPTATGDADAVEFITTAEGVIPAAVVPATDGFLDLAVEAELSGAVGNVPVQAVQLLLSPVGGVRSVSNPLATGGGQGVESDALYRDRLMLELSAPQGAGNIGDYQRWALAYPGVGYASVFPLWNGPGTVRVVITDPGNDPVPTAVVSGLQAELDPVPQQGRGLAPVGASVSVATPTSLVINVAASPAPAGVRHRKGYSLDGDAGTRPTRARIESALREYVDALRPGEDVMAQHAEAQFFRVRGVFNIVSVTLNGGAVGANVTVAELQVATLGTVTLNDLGEEAF